MREDREVRTYRFFLALFGPVSLAAVGIFFLELFRGEIGGIGEAFGGIAFLIVFGALYMGIQSFIYALLMELVVIPRVQSFSGFSFLSGVFGYFAGLSIEPDKPLGEISVTGACVGIAMGVLLFRVSSRARKGIS